MKDTVIFKTTLAPNTVWPYLNLPVKKVRVAREPKPEKKKRPEVSKAMQLWSFLRSYGGWCKRQVIQDALGDRAVKVIYILLDSGCIMSDGKGMYRASSEPPPRRLPSSHKLVQMEVSKLPRKNSNIDYDRLASLIWSGPFTFLVDEIPTRFYPKLSERKVPYARRMRLAKVDGEIVRVVTLRIKE